MHPLTALSLRNCGQEFIADSPIVQIEDLKADESFSSIIDNEVESVIADEDEDY